MLFLFFLLLTERAAHRGFQRRQGLVVIVNRVDVVTFGALHRVLRIRYFERGPAAEPVAVLRQAQLVSRGIPALGLHRDGLVGGLQRQVAAFTSVRTCSAWARTDSSAS